MRTINGLRFIVGSSCNFNCFFCHHEGYLSDSNIKNDRTDKLEKLKDFCKQNHIYKLSITGGEPFLFFEYLQNILRIFSDKEFEITINSNFALIDRYINYIKDYKKIEFHVNLSSLDKKKHKGIVGGNQLEKVLSNLDLIKSTHHKVCLNILALKDINDNELVNFLHYAKENNFLPRFLVLLTEKSREVLDVDDIMNLIPGSTLVRKYSYGRHDVSNSAYGDYEIVRCLCIGKECDICKKETFLHLTPELNIKYCMNSSNEVMIDYTSSESIVNSFDKAINMLETIK